MNKFEDHWRKKMEDPEEHKDFLKEKVKEDMWEKILVSKNGFEQSWQKKMDDPEAWEGIVTEVDKQALWQQLQTSLAQFELQWREKIDDASQVSTLFLDEAAKERIAANIFAEKETFEIEWQDKMNDPVLAGQDILNGGSKDRIWHNIQSAHNNTTAPTQKEKRKSLLTLRWSHAAALLIGAFGALLVWDRSSVPLQNTLVVTPPSGAIIPAANLVVTQKENPGKQEERLSTVHDARAKPATRTVAKSKVTATVKESREIIEQVSGKVRPVKALQSAVVLAQAKPVINTDKVTASEDKTKIVPGNPEIEIAINKTVPAKKVVHISDIRPAQASVKGTAIYGRAFGEGKEKRNEKSTMTFNSVLKNYK